jgi:hypothetical protein
MSFHTIPESLSYGAVSVTPTEVGGVLVGRSTNNGLVVTWLDASGSRVTPDTAIPGDVIWGIADAGNRWGVLVQIGDDVLDLVTLKAGGGALVQTRVTGGVPHDTTGNTWFGSMIQDGDLIWTGTKFAAYYTVQRLWPDGIAHYGDQLRLYDGMGSQIQELWDWGCSHSMELRLAHNGDNLGAVCASDCYPSKGIHFNHRGAKIVDDQDASNCGGRYGTSLGGVIPHNNGFWVSFTATQDRQSRDVGLRYINANGRAADEIQWVTQDDTSDYYLRSAQLGESLLIGYSTGSGKTTLVRRDIDTGGPLGAPITLAEVNSWHLSEFFTYANGDAGWLGLDQNSLKLARVRHCGLP